MQINFVYTSLLILLEGFFQPPFLLFRGEKYAYINWFLLVFSTVFKFSAE